MPKKSSFFQSLSKQAKIFLFSTLGLFLIILIISITSILSQKDSGSDYIRIDNFSENTSAPNGYRRYIEDTIWQTIAQQDGVTREDLASATIRQGSTTGQVDNDITTTSFLVDIESLHYTFRITFNWNQKTNKIPTDPYISVTCPKPEEVIYTETRCPIDATLQLRDYLPHELTLSDGTQINLTLERYAEYQNHGNEQYLFVSLPTCNNYNQLLESKEITERWLNSLYADMSNLRIEVSCSYCPLNQTQTGTDRCKLTNTDTENTSLLNQLPYADVNFKIEPLDPSTHTIKIIRFIERSSPDYPNHIQEAESRYLNEALDWIKSRGFNPTDYPYTVVTEYL